MDNKELLYAMEDAQQHRAKIVLKNGEVHTGYADVFETAYDNDSEFASICLDDDEIGGTFYYENEIESIEIIE